MAADSSGSSTRPSLLLRIRDPRDTEAWQTFVDVYGRLVYRHCRNRGLRHEDAENVTQVESHSHHFSGPHVQPVQSCNFIIEGKLHGQREAPAGRRKHLSADTTLHEEMP